MGRLERVTLENFKSYPGTQVREGEGGCGLGMGGGSEGGRVEAGVCVRCVCVGWGKRR